MKAKKEDKCLRTVSRHFLGGSFFVGTLVKKKFDCQNFMDRWREQESDDAQNLKNSSAAALSLHNILALKFFLTKVPTKSFHPENVSTRYVHLSSFLLSSLSSFIKDSSEMMISVFSL